MEQLINTFITLLRCGLRGTAPSPELAEVLTPEMLSKLYTVARKHDLIHLLALALKNGNILGEDEISKKFLKGMFRAAKRYEKAKYEEQCIYELFAKNKIAYVPLKGAIVEEYYPEPWMRTRGDIDILVEEKDVEKAQELLVSSLHYDVREKKYHDILMFAPSDVCLELHFSIMEQKENIDPVLARVWDYVVPMKDDTFQSSMSPEFFAFHMLAHMSYHFTFGGCGARYIIDMWLLEQSGTYDKEKVRELCEQAGILRFAEYVWKLANVWFGEEEHDEISKLMERYILAHGTFGTKKSKIMAQRVKGKGQFRYIWGRMFMPYENLCIIFPQLKRRPILYPYYSVKHWGKVLREKREKAVVREMNLNREMKQSSIDKLDYLLANLKLKSHKK